MPKEIKIIGGEKFRAGIYGRVTLSYMLITVDGEPKYHYDNKEGRLEVFLLQSPGGGVSRLHDFEFELPDYCKEVRFTEGSQEVYDELEKQLIDQFISKSENYSRK